MNQPIQIRPFQPESTDYQAVAVIVDSFPDELLCDFEYRSGAELQAFDIWFADTPYTLTRYIAEENGVILGYGHYFHTPWNFDPQHYWLMVRISPQHQHRAIGTMLYNRILADLKQAGARVLRTMVPEAAPQIGALLERLGFHEILRTIPFTLDIPGFDESPFQGVSRRLASHGITITTLANELQRTPDCLTHLYELHTALTREVPLPEQPRMSLEWFTNFISTLPVALPDGFFIAMDGTHYIGESFMHRVNGDPATLSQKVTGVLPEYRGKGIALALKLHTIAYARANGYACIRTCVDTNNPAMLAVGNKLGFIQQSGGIVFDKEL